MISSTPSCSRSPQRPSSWPITGAARKCPRPAFGSSEAHALGGSSTRSCCMTTTSHSHPAWANNGGTSSVAQTCHYTASSPHPVDLRRRRSRWATQSLTKLFSSTFASFKTTKEEVDMPFTLAEFCDLLTAPARGQDNAIVGWKHIHEHLPTFLEAPLSLSRLSSDSDAESLDHKEIILVSAPGAVGKTTLAKELAFRTGAMLLDLAEAEPVGANTVVGGLASTNLYAPFQEGNASLVIDGLDEARMCVTQDAFAAFIKDVKRLSAPQRKPIVLLGRTGAVEEAWLCFSDFGIKPVVLEIDYYNEEQALEFAIMQAKQERGYEHKPDAQAIALFLDDLKDKMPADDRTFLGYSPVLIAIAKYVADPSNPDVKNTKKLISSIKKGEKYDITLLSKISQYILDREQKKLSNLEFDDSTLCKRLYAPKEQLARLIKKIYGTKLALSLPPMSLKDRETYNNALVDWVSAHPFLDGTGKSPSSAVFGGLIAAEALFSKESSENALSMELNRGIKVNPFLAEFYLLRSQEMPIVPAAHVGLLYSSLRARLSLGQMASLHIDGEIDEDSPKQSAEVEITRYNQDYEERKSIIFQCEHNGIFRFGPRIQDVSIVCPQSEFIVDYGSEGVLVAPVSIDVRKMTFKLRTLITELPKTKKSTIKKEQFGEGNVTLISTEVEANDIKSPPTCRSGVQLAISWPGSTEYPWSEFSFIPSSLPDQRMDEALRRLFQILPLFRSHKKGSLAKYRDAIEHRRRSRGAGRHVIDALRSEGVLSMDEMMYYLDSDKLEKIVGLTYHHICTKRTTPATINFLERVLRDNPA